MVRRPILNVCAPPLRASLDHPHPRVPHEHRPQPVRVAEIQHRPERVRGVRLVPPLDPGAWERLGLSESVFSPAIKQIDRQITEIVRFFFHD